jgi:hypothetical protein
VGGDLNAAMVLGLTAGVRGDLEGAFREQSGPDREFIWSDSGEHTADVVGTVGAVEFRGMKGATLQETPRLESDAQAIPGLVPPTGGALVVTQFRGGVMGQGPSMSVGYGDSLGINLIGGQADTGAVSANGGHGVHTYHTEWQWDGGKTSWAFDHQIDESGSPRVTGQPTSSSPRDFSGSRLMPWNWFG